jgi:hypothetical protein
VGDLVGEERRDGRPATDRIVHQRRRRGTMKHVLRMLTIGIMALLVMSSAALPASAGATVFRETITGSSTETGLRDDCRPGVTGTIVGTGVVSYQSVETAEGFHIVGTETDTGRIDWSDGSYSVIGAVDHFSYTTGKGVEVFTNAHQDFVDTYTADGVFLFRETFHTTERFTIAGGVLRVEFERGHLHSFGGC